MQLTRQVGEHLVVAELGRRGLIASPFSGNVPTFDVLVADNEGRAIPIQVKAIRGPSWQFRINSFLEIEVIDEVQHVKGKVKLSMSDLVCVFVHLRGTGEDDFYVLQMRDLQDHFASTYTGGRRPRNPHSMHCAIWPQKLERFRDNWGLISEALGAASLHA